MANSALSSSVKKLIKIDVSSDTVCPWCFVGKNNLEKAMDQMKDQFDFEVRWHPFFLDPSAPKEGVRKSEFYEQKFGARQYGQMLSRMREIFRGLGYEYDTSGLTGNTLDSHRLITFAAHQGYDKQNALVSELFSNYFCEGKYIGDRQVLLDAATKVGIEGAAELLEDPSKGLEEVLYPDLNLSLYHLPKFFSWIAEINGKYKLSGGQPPETFLRAFQVVGKEISS